VSKDASFVFLDGRPLCAWPGKHEWGGGGYGKYGLDLDLKAGTYPIEYYYAGEKPLPCFALGWIPPWFHGEKKGGQPRVELVPPDAFVHTPVARTEAPERRGEATLAAFRHEQADQLVTETAQYTRMDLASECKGVPQDATVEWSFGDGVTGTGATTQDHVYVGDGPFTCTLHITGKDGKTLDQYRALIRIVMPLKNLTFEDEAAVKQYIDAITRSTCTKVPAETMRALWDLVEISEDVVAVRPFCEAMVKQFGLEGDGWHAGDRLALALSIQEPERAEKLYARLAESAPDPLAAARCRMELIELVLHKLKDPDRALALAKALRDRGSGWLARLGAVKMGDVHRAKGQFEEAEKLYRDAAHIAYGATDRRLVALRQGGYLETAETYIRTGYLRAARDLLVQWEGNYPDGKLGGDLILMTAKYFEKLGDPQRVLHELTTLTQINPLSPYLPEIELRMARAYARLGQRAKAVELYDKIMYEYPHSDAARQAQKERP
jgi:tetratricopeptide (TPR) repeat protein